MSVPTHRAALKSAVKSLWPLAVVTLLLGALVGLAVTAAVVPPSYTATIRLRILPNKGGNPLNSSADASVESVALVQSNVRHVARQSFHGAALADPAALFRSTCRRDPTDTIVVCQTTSSSRAAGRAVLNQLMASFIPISVEAQIQTYRETMAEMDQQGSQLAVQDRRLRRSIARLRARPSARSRAALKTDRAELRDDITVRGEIKHRVATMDKQVAYTPRTLRILGDGATAVAADGKPTLLRGTLFGLLAACLALTCLGLARFRTAVFANPKVRLERGVQA